MVENIKKQSKISELRQDLVTGDWVVIATGRSKRPKEFAKSEEIKEPENPETECPFCNPAENEPENRLLVYNDNQDEWTLRVIHNKYPAFDRKGEAPQHFEEGPYFGMESIGYHEVIITRDHRNQIANLNKVEVAEILDAYQERYVDLMNKKSVNYIEIFHNHGRESGASIVHPHSQLMAIPVISPYVKSELDGAENYHRTSQTCVYCTMLEWELGGAKKKRVIFENDDFVAFCPFASRVAFEVWVAPKKHKPYFERITREEKVSAGEALQVAVGKIYKALNNPPYNFYLHTSPCDGRDYPYYHWHIEILPRTSVWAGFELSTGIEISTLEPEEAAEFLREQ